eukprot:Lithocolla_globosa_v1_NODE_1446_length_2570_cov_8.811531.p1 type:complete len:624 gc:universal NODE_1446_length_2570_cov_8.811531:1872-1(-)
MTTKKQDDKHQKILQDLAIKQENKKCMDCPSKGTSQIVIPFSSFVCLPCSGLHREFNHRIKSISNSRFTPEEIATIKRGGNDRCRQIYLATWNPRDFAEPPVADTRGIRDFMRLKYVIKKWYRSPESLDEMPPVQEIPGKESLPKLIVAPQKSSSFAPPPSASAHAPAAAAPAAAAPAPSVFEAFGEDPFGAKPKQASSSDPFGPSSGAPQASSGIDAFSTQPAPSADPFGSSDPFGASGSADPFGGSSSSNDPFGAPAGVSGGNGGNGFASFGGQTQQAPASQPTASSFATDPFGSGKSDPFGGSDPFGAGPNNPPSSNVFASADPFGAAPTPSPVQASNNVFASADPFGNPSPSPAPTANNAFNDPFGSTSQPASTNKSVASNQSNPFGAPQQQQQSTQQSTQQSSAGFGGQDPFGSSFGGPKQDAFGSLAVLGSTPSTFTPTQQTPKPQLTLAQQQQQQQQQKQQQLLQQQQQARQMAQQQQQQAKPQAVAPPMFGGDLLQPMSLMQPESNNSPSPAQTSGNADSNDRYSALRDLSSEINWSSAPSGPSAPDASSAPFAASYDSQYGQPSQGFGGGPQGQPYQASHQASPAFKQSNPFAAGPPMPQQQPQQQIKASNPFF